MGNSMPLLSVICIEIIVCMSYISINQLFIF